MTERQCRDCGETFTSKAPNALYCSADCRERWRLRTDIPKRLSRIEGAIYQNEEKIADLLDPQRVVDRLRLDIKSLREDSDRLSAQLQALPSVGGAS